MVVLPVNSLQTVTDREVTGIVERFDVNGDGELDKDEWLELAAIMFLGKGERELKNETFSVRKFAQTRSSVAADEAQCATPQLSPFCPRCAASAVRKAVLTRRSRPLTHADLFSGGNRLVGTLACCVRSRVRDCHLIFRVPAAPFAEFASQKFDADRKGFVTAEDIRTFATGMGKSFDFSFEDMIAACKPATEGQLSRPEFDTLFSVLFPDVGKKAQPKRAPRKA